MRSTVVFVGAKRNKQKMVYCCLGGLYKLHFMLYAQETCMFI